MPALTGSGHAGEILWLGRVANRGGSLRSDAVSRLRPGFAGPGGEAHAGLTRPACARVAAPHPRGTGIRNVRQLPILSAEELAAIAADIGLAAPDPALLGASAVVAGIADVTHLPPGARLQGKDGATVVADTENLPCQLSAREIEAEAPGRGARCRAAARGRRGVTARIEREREWRPGERLRRHEEAQRPWRP